MKVNCILVYPNLDRPGVPEKYRNHQITQIELNVGCDTWRTNTAMRHGFCELIYAGAGNDPGLWDGVEGQPFDSGDQGVNNVHRQWEKAKIRSASIGDLVGIDLNGKLEWWVCDNCGWTLLTNEQATSWLDYPREYGCCPFELNKWMDTLTTKVGDAMTV